jgi:hypothetical protein
MASPQVVSLNNAGKAAIESIVIKLTWKLQRKLTFSDALIEAEKIVCASMSPEDASVTDVSL